MLVKAFEDYLKGPDVIKKHDPEKLHADILKLSKIHQNQTIDYSFSPPSKMQIGKASIWQKLASLLTLNGHFLPHFLLSDQDAFVWYGPDFPGQRSRAFAKKRVSIFKEKTHCLYQYEMDQKAGLKLFFGWLYLVLKNVTKWTQINAAWKNSASEFVSPLFWQTYLQDKQGGEA
jgi:galactofuranosylgalactofuranosylrhamnosyl-N-acetylglucosaminyl-diphospho-decaprenol beta-1,5/1,6-galactofuranosyltransferase